MANLPNKPFVFNYNARDYDPATYTIPKTSGQTLDKDMVWTGTTRTGITVSQDHITIPASAKTQIDFASTAANPLNVVASANNLTVVFKTKYVYTSSYSGSLRGNFLCNQDANINWVIRIGSRENYPLDNTRISMCHNNTAPNFDTGLGYTSGETITGALVINNGVFTIKNLKTNETTDPITISSNSGYGNAVNRLYSDYTGDFYWCYASREVLTDEEITQVVKYNDGGGIDITPDHADFTFTGGTASTVVESETPWSGATTSPWISFVPTTGESGTTNITITVPKNDFNARTGKITFTDEDNTAEFNITQGGTSGRVPNMKLYKGDRRLN